ncbi:hypothetical protein SH2C18_31520 [Clostridium sediminicola]|uniref:hypothetical protein n=1 Tax=Clostridium sediminicola TaxID=3114879 RepID=UPI0031F220A8
MKQVVEIIYSTKIKIDKMTSKEEKKFLKRLKKFPQDIFNATDIAVMEGFEYFTTSE